MSQVGEAFVRIRPDTDRFRADLRGNVNRDVRQVERSLASSNREFGRFGRGALVGTGALGGLGRAAAFASSAFIGGAGLTYALKSTVDAAEEAQVVQGQLENALDNLGISFAENRVAIEERTQALSQMSGIDDELVTRTFTNFVRRTGDVTKALRLNAIAIDVARGRNISLESASSLVTRASLGMAGALRRVGIAAQEGATATQLLELLQRKYAGSAERYGQTAAGAQERFSVALENTQEIIGEAVLPALTRALNKATEWLNETENQQRIQNAVNKTVEKGSDAFDFLAAAIGGASDAYGKFSRLAEKLPGDDQDGFFKTLLTGTLVAQFNHFRDANYDLARALHLMGGEAGNANFALGQLGDTIGRLSGITRISPLGSGGGLTALEALRQDREAGGGFGLPRPQQQTAFVPLPITDAQRRQEALAAASAGTDTEIAAINAELGFDQKALAFAKARIAAGKGNLRATQDQVIRLQGDIRSALDRLTGISEQRAADAQAARDKIRADAERRKQLLEDMVTDLLSGVSLGVEGVDPLTIAQVNKAIEDRKQARIQKLLGVPDRLSLETDIQEQRSDNEAKLIPFIQRELAAVNKRLALLRQIGASRVQILQQTLTQQQLKRRIRDIRNQDRKEDGFTLTEFFAEAGRQQSLYGSNVGGSLSAQDARAAVAKNALNGATIVQNFHGDMPNPAQALQQASQAARALK